MNTVFKLRAYSSTQILRIRGVLARYGIAYKADVCGGLVVDLGAKDAREYSPTKFDQAPGELLPGIEMLVQKIEALGTGDSMNTVFKIRTPRKEKFWSIRIILKDCGFDVTRLTMKPPPFGIFFDAGRRVCSSIRTKRIFEKSAALCLAHPENCTAVIEEFAYLRLRSALHKAEPETCCELKYYQSTHPAWPAGRTRGVGDAMAYGLIGSRAGAELRPAGKTHPENWKFRAADREEAIDFYEIAEGLSRTHPLAFVSTDTGSEKATKEDEYVNGVFRKKADITKFSGYVVVQGQLIRKSRGKHVTPPSGEASSVPEAASYPWRFGVALVFRVGHPSEFSEWEAWAERVNKASYNLPARNFQVKYREIK